MSSIRSARSHQIESLGRAVVAALDALAKAPRNELAAKAAKAAAQRMMRMGPEARAAYDAASDEKREAWARRAFREELDRLTKEKA